MAGCAWDRQAEGVMPLHSSVADSHLQRHSRITVALRLLDPKYRGLTVSLRRLPTTMTSRRPITNACLFCSPSALPSPSRFECLPLHCPRPYFVVIACPFKQGSTGVKRCFPFLNHLPDHRSCFVLLEHSFSQASYLCSLSVI